MILPSFGLEEIKEFTKAICMRSALLQLPGAANISSESQAEARSGTDQQHKGLRVHYIFTIRRREGIVHHLRTVFSEA